MSHSYFTHATPTLFNSGTPMPQMSSCFLLTMQDDSSTAFTTPQQCALISKSAGGIGLSIHHPLKGFLHQGHQRHLQRHRPHASCLQRHGSLRRPGGGKRKGSIAVYLEPWHPDILQFDLEEHGKEEM